MRTAFGTFCLAAALVCPVFAVNADELTCGVVSTHGQAFGLQANWYGRTKEELRRLVDRHRGEKDAYAVFDCDNTTTIGDISQAYQANMLEDLHFAFGPKRMAEIFAKDIPDVNRPLISGNPNSTAANLTADLADAYRELLELKKAGGDYRASPVFEEFAAKYHVLFVGIIRTFGAGFACQWIGYAFTGYTHEEIAAYERVVVKRELVRGRLYQQSYTVPAAQARRAGVCTGSVSRGLAFPAENIALFRALREAGIVPHIVSASSQELLLAVFTDPAFGYGFSPDCLFGYTLQKDAAGKVLPVSAPDDWRPRDEGKVELIRKILMPRFGGREPVLVGGDSTGDVPMLTAFKGMERGLIYNHRPLKDDSLGALVREALSFADSRYLLQGRDNSTVSFVPRPTSVTVSACE